MSEIEYATFSIIQNGMKVASGYGPYEMIKREADHYAAIYGQDGPVTKRIRKQRKDKP